MDIIFVSGATSRARTLRVDWRHGAFAAFALCALLIGVALAFNHVAAPSDSFLSRLTSPRLVFMGQSEEARESEEMLQGHLNAMAIRVGELQARMLRLDGLGERLAQIAGLKPHELQSLQVGAIPGRGGAESSVPPHALSITELNGLLDRLVGEVEQHSDQLGVLETLLVNDSVKRNLVPTLAPIGAGWFSSNFGNRIDPFTGLQSFHEGIDFPADAGTPIMAAASGIVTSTETHPQYGKMIEIDHGNGFVSRYAHTSRLLVKEGDVVMRGQQIATVGSTGRSTGPHLHFEVRQNGVPQNPARFLQSSN